MEALISDPRMKAFRATDAYAVDAFAISRWLRGKTGDGLAGEIRRTAVRAGGSVVAASGSPPGGRDERLHLEKARAALIEGRYYLYLARRFGLLDVRRYRGLTSRQDAAMRELESLLRPGAPREAS